MRYPTSADWEAARDNDQHSKVRELLPRLDWHALWEAEDEEEWLLYPLIPARRLIALFSPAKVGKSLLMLEIAAALSTGRKVLGRDPGRRIRTLYIDFENDPRGDVRTRLQDMGYGPDDLSSLDYLSFPSLPYLDSEAGASALLAAVEAYSPELVVIDTISRAVAGEENDNNTWLNLYKHTGLALKQAKVAMIRLDHTGKDETKGQRGGSAKSGDVDAIWKLTTVAKERFRLECTDSRFALEDKELTLTRHDEPLLHHTKEDSSRADDTEAKILELIARADQDNVARDIGRPAFMAWAKGRGYGTGRWVREVLRRRKDLSFNPAEELVPRSNGHGPGMPGPGPGSSSDQVSDSERKTLVPTNGTSPDQGIGSLPGPVPPSLGGTSGPAGQANGKTTDPKPGDEPCTECGKSLGWSMVRRGLTVHVPECSAVMR